MLSWFDVTLPNECFASDQDPRISLCIIDWGCPYIWISLRVYGSSVTCSISTLVKPFPSLLPRKNTPKSRFRLSSHYTPSTGIRDWDTDRYIQINVWPVKSWLSKAWCCTLWLLAAEFISSPFVSCFMTCFVQAVQVICAMIWVLQSKLRIAVFAILNVVNASECVFVCVFVWLLSLLLMHFTWLYFVSTDLRHWEDLRRTSTDNACVCVNKRFEAIAVI